MTREQRHYTRHQRDLRAQIDALAVDYDRATRLAVALGQTAAGPAEARDYAASTLNGAAILARRILDQHAASLGVRS